jgi:hypothetical protein
MKEIYRNYAALVTIQPNNRKNQQPQNPTTVKKQQP